MITLSDLEQRVSRIEQHLGLTALASRPVDLALFYSSSVEHWQRELERLCDYPQAVINAEFATISHNSDAKPYANGSVPLWYLLAEDVQVTLYNNPWAVWTASPLGGPAMWLVAQQHKQADKFGAWLRNKQGQRVTVHGGQMSVIDARNDSYTDWLFETLAGLPCERLFLDNAWWHQVTYHQRLVSDEEWGMAAAAFYGSLRAVGKHITLNGGWEMRTATAAIWDYPLMPHCDGVAIEIPAGFSEVGWWSLFDYSPLDTTALERVVADWLQADKEVSIIARYKRSEPLKADEPPFDTLAKHREFWRTFAQRTGVSVSAQYDYTSIPAVST